MWSHVCGSDFQQYNSRGASICHASIGKQTENLSELDRVETSSLQMCNAEAAEPSRHTTGACTQQVARSGGRQRARCQQLDGGWFTKYKNYPVCSPHPKSLKRPALSAHPIQGRHAAPLRWQALHGDAALCRSHAGSGGRCRRRVKLDLSLLTPPAQYGNQHCTRGKLERRLSPSHRCQRQARRQITDGLQTELHLQWPDQGVEALPCCSSTGQMNQAPLLHSCTPTASPMVASNTAATPATIPMIIPVLLLLPPLSLGGAVLCPLACSDPCWRSSK